MSQSILPPAIQMLMYYNIPLHLFRESSSEIKEMIVNLGDDWLANGKTFQMGSPHLDKEFILQILRGETFSDEEEEIREEDF